MDINAVLANIILVAATGLIGIGIELLRRKIGNEKIAKINQELWAKRDLVGLGIAFVEQAYKDLHGQDKYNAAVGWIQGRASKIGLSFSDDEIKGLIESALAEANRAFKQE